LAFIAKARKGSWRMTARDPEINGETFTHRMVGSYGHRLHCVIGGSGDPVLLVPGWPQTWYAWRRVMPLLARRFSVVAVDPPGLGESDKPIEGYDTGSVAARLKELTTALGWDRFHFVGHDIGCWIGYPFAATFPEAVRRLVLIDATVPGVVSSDAYAFAPERINRNWHFFFNALPDLPEALVVGRERAFLSWLFQSKSANPAAIDNAALDEYVRCYSAPGAWRAGVAYYRALFEDIAQNRAHASKRIKTPILAIGGDAGLGEMMEQMMRTVADNVTGRVIRNCGHYVPEEVPELLSEILFEFLK
jgi:pimeloyl-ACP methyl ester carboxylesterase